MNLETGLAIFGALATGTNLLNAWLTNQVRAEITAMKLEVAEQRAVDRERFDERYMSRTEIETRFRSFEARLGIKLH